MTPPSELESLGAAPKWDARSEDPQYNPPVEKSPYSEPNATLAAGAEAKRRICGVRRTTFWLLLALVALTIGAAVAIGVVATRPKTGGATGTRQEADSAEAQRLRCVR